MIWLIINIFFSCTSLLSLINQLFLYSNFLSACSSHALNLITHLFDPFSFYQLPPMLLMPHSGSHPQCFICLPFTPFCVSFSGFITLVYGCSLVGLTCAINSTLPSLIPLHAHSQAFCPQLYKPNYSYTSYCFTQPAWAY